MHILTCRLPCHGRHHCGLVVAGQKSCLHDYELLNCNLMTIIKKKRALARLKDAETNIKAGRVYKGNLRKLLKKGSTYYIDVGTHDVYK